MYQVNKTQSVDNDITFWVSKWSSDGYVGETIDTIYADGIDKTKWCIFAGGKIECQIMADILNEGYTTVWFSGEMRIFKDGNCRAIICTFGPEELFCSSNGVFGWKNRYNFLEELKSRKYDAVMASFPTENEYRQTPKLLYA